MSNFSATNYPPLNIKNTLINFIEHFLSSKGSMWFWSQSNQLLHFSFGQYEVLSTLEKWYKPWGFLISLYHFYYIIHSNSSYNYLNYHNHCPSLWMSLDKFKMYMTWYYCRFCHLLCVEIIYIYKVRMIHLWNTAVYIVNCILLFLWFK